MVIIGITGTLGSGKGTIVEYLVNNKGFVHYSVSNYLKDILINNKLEINRTNLQNIGNEIREKHGSDFITKQLFKLAKSKNKNAVIESIRNPKEAEFIKSKGGVLFAITADQGVRYKRIIKRSSEKDHVTFKEFQKQEMREIENVNPNLQNLSKCILMTDYKFDNNSTIEKLYEQIEKTIQKII